MLQKIFVILLTCISFVAFMITAPLVAMGDTQVDELIELTGEEYEEYINNCLNRSSSKSKKSRAASSYSVNLDKGGDYTKTNVPKKSGTGSVGDVIKSIGSDIIRDVINNSAITNSGYQIPEFRQQAGKVRNVYNSGMVEIITCYMTTYQTVENGVLGYPTGKYNNHCILAFIREIDGYYTTTTICDTYSEQFCPSFSDSGNLNYTFYPSDVIAGIRFYDYETGTTLAGIGNRVYSYGSTYNVRFYDFGGTSKEFPLNVSGDFNIYFGSYQKKGISEISSGDSYKTLYTLLMNYNAFRYVDNNTPSYRGIVFSVMDTVTNNYQNFSQYKEYDNNTEYKQSITYLDQINSSDVINSNNVNNYDFLTIEGDTLTTNNNYDSWYQSNVTDVVNNNITNVYNNYWITPTDPPETAPPVTQPPTEPPTESSIQLPGTTASGSAPPATIPTGLPSLPIYTVDPKYTIDMEEFFSEYSDIYSKAKPLDDSNSFWLVRCIDYVLKHVEVFSIFLLVFVLALVRVFLWK